MNADAGAPSGPPVEDGPWPIGVEEEYLLVDAADGELRQESAAVREVARSRFAEEIDPEFLRSQVEVATSVCATVEAAGDQLRNLRHRVGSAADVAGCRLVAAASHPTARWADQEVTDKDRYHGLEGAMAQVARESVICGLHVHVGIPEPEDRIRAMGGARPWLGPLLALSASSPYWEGRDTGYASYRTPIFRRWPQTGVPHPFAGWEDFEGLVADLVAAGAVDDGTNLYWDLRPSVRFPTVEWRVADACPSLDDALTIAALARALLRTVVDPDCAPPGLSASDGARPAAVLRTEVLEAAVRRAARYGLSDRLVDPSTGRLASAAAVVGQMVKWCRSALDAADDMERVDEGVARILACGNSAERQRRAFARRGSFTDVVDLLVAETAGRS